MPSEALWAGNKIEKKCILSSVAIARSDYGFLLHRTLGELRLRDINHGDEIMPESTTMKEKR
jgi:hypothetical protein